MAMSFLIEWRLYLPAAGEKHDSEIVATATMYQRIVTSLHPPVLEGVGHKQCKVWKLVTSDILFQTFSICQ